MPTDDLPRGARCNFEAPNCDWCDWKNIKEDNEMDWSLHRGPTPREQTGPDFDHTFKNRSGQLINYFPSVYTSGQVCKLPG